MTRAAAAVSLMVALAGCPPPRPSEPDASFDAGPPAVVDAGPPELTMSIRAGLGDGGTAELTLDPGARPTVDPPASLAVAASAPLRNYRVRVFDEADRVVPSDDRAADTDAGTQYVMTFPAPLQTGHRYTLVVDAQTGAEFGDAFGRTHADVRVPFQVSGERERPAKRDKRHRRK